MSYTDNAIIDSMNAIDEASKQEMESLQAEMQDYNNEEYVEALPTEAEVAQWAYEERCDANYSTNRSNFEEMLVSECGYSRMVAENSDDGWEEFCRSEYNIYLSNNK